MTSQALTPRRRRNLEQKAREFGFTLQNIHAQDDFVNRLYRSPEWRLELLGLSGDPPALSTLPRTHRPVATQPLLGRSVETAWVREQSSDCLLAGHPGSGKTAVLAELALTGEGLFVVTDDLGKVADAVRAQEATRIFVDDAHHRQELVLDLRSLREEIGADYKIVATCWPGERDAVQRSLSLTSQAVCNLPLLTRPVIADVIRASGLYGPDLLIGKIIDQARGKPGLAVTLSLLCLRQGPMELVTGDLLFRDVVEGLRELTGGQVVPVLAAFAVGGDAGLQMSAVADTLQLSLSEVWEIATQIAAGGVLREVRGKTLAVEPAALRDALIRTVFFAGARSLPIAPLLAALPSVASAAATLARVLQQGGAVPDPLLRDLLERCVPSPNWPTEANRAAWLTYAYSGPVAIEWILDRHPELLTLVARAGLTHHPARTISLLLAAAVGDERELHSHPDHPLRVLEDWVKAARPGTGEVLARRTAVLGAVTKRCRETSASPTVAGRALSIAFSLQYEWSREDPIEQNSVTFHSSHVTAEEIESLLDQWPDALEVLRTLSPATCKQLDPMVREWAFPGMLVVRSGVSDEVIQATHSGAARMLEDLSTLWQDHPGIVAWAARIAKLADLNVALPAEVDSDFKLLFPEEDRIGGWSKHFQQLHGAARETGTRWSAEEPVAVAARLVRYDAEASLGGHRWPRLVNVAAEGIAEHVTDRIAWIVALVAAESAPDIVAPFLRLAMASDGEAADAIWIRSFETDRYRHLSLAEAIRAPSLSDTVLSQTPTGLGGATELIKTACFRSEVPPRLLEQLLLHSEKAVAEAAAEGLWHSGNEGEIPAELREAWEQAVVQHLDSAPTLEQIFSKHPTLARDWLVAHARRTGEGAWRLSGSINYAVSVLHRDTRRELVVELPCNGHGPGLFKLLVGNDRDLYRSFLERPAPEYIHLEPLEGKLTEAWVCLAEVALEVGYEPEDLVAAAYGHAWSWWGKESSLWQSWADAFAPLEQHDDNRIREIGRIGREEAEHRRDRATEREQDEAVFGRS